MIQIQGGLFQAALIFQGFLGRFLDGQKLSHYLDCHVKMANFDGWYLLRYLEVHPSLMVWGASHWGIVLASPMTGYFLVLCIQQHFPHWQCGGLWLMLELAAWANLLCLPLTSDVRGACSELRGRLLLEVATLFQGGKQSIGSGDQSVPFWYVQGLISWFTQAFGDAWFYLAMLGLLHWIRPYPSI